MLMLFDFGETGNLLFITEAFHDQREDIHLETCCITGGRYTCMDVFAVFGLHLNLPSIVLII